MQFPCYNHYDIETKKALYDLYIPAKKLEYLKKVFSVSPQSLVIKALVCVALTSLAIAFTSFGLPLGLIMGSAFLLHTFYVDKSNKAAIAEYSKPEIEEINRSVRRIMDSILRHSLHLEYSPNTQL